MEQIEKTIRSLLDPINIENPDINAVVGLGDKAVPILIGMFRSPKTDNGYYNQAVVAAALLMFAQQGNKEADRFARDVAARRVPLLDSGMGNAAYRICVSFVQESPMMADKQVGVATEVTKPLSKTNSIEVQCAGAHRFHVPIAFSGMLSRGAQKGPVMGASKSSTL
ncbi:hypothetical protein CKO51_31385 [Rhodopirellula sp. SM50]|nr:hypothetical protein [Rhodopirellula sp. SM50]PAY15549.1 hypothetical protein CKO51_31385 [Rhodopirellula sp. SM50]